MGESVPSISYLGPSGSYTEVALLANLSPGRMLPQPSISAAISALVAKEVEYAFVPLENVCQGPVSETLDALLQHQGQVQIVASFTQRIEHCFGIFDPALSELTARRNQVIKVLSHEQALRQCSSFIAQNFAHANLVSVASSAAAAEQLALSRDPSAGVIAAAETLERCGLRVIVRDIGDAAQNSTRFALLSTAPSLDKLQAIAPSKEDSIFVTSLAIHPGRDRKGMLHELLTIISVEHGANILSIHSRPDARGGFVFFLDLEGATTAPQLSSCLSALRDYCAIQTGGSAQIFLFGSYSYQRFYDNSFKCAGVIGSEGVMGQWFCQFFREIGVPVLSFDKKTNSSVSLAEVAARCDLIVLSVPMREMTVVAQELSGSLRPETLLVENASIKGGVLPQLARLVPSGVEVLGVHLMFGGKSALRGENVIISKCQSSAERAQAFEDLLYKHGANVHYADSVNHDRVTAYIQALTQLNLLALADVLAQSFDNFAEVAPFTTPNSRSILQSAQRVVNQSDALLLDLQLLNEQAPLFRRRFLQAIFNLVCSLEQGGQEELLQCVARVRDFLARGSSGNSNL